jgi:UDP-N-acetylmuramoyl-L-alanyl-D-glutamate--2,6-diaminopimelate ligase
MIGTSGLRLIDLLPEGEWRRDGGGDLDGVTIRGLSADSRAIEPGFLFAALPGSRGDGARFVGDALSRGAAAIVIGHHGGSDATAADTAGAPIIAVDNPRRALALMAARFYGRQPEVVAAVTGTNGKTSVAWFLRQIWEKLGMRAAAVGTLGVIGPTGIEPGSLTTPEPVALHRRLARLAEDGCEHLAIEASSHGLDQHRLDGLRIAAGAFTNLTRDHLDYHGSEDAYLAAKLRLFAEVVVRGGGAVINADAAQAAAVSAAAAGRLRVFTYGAAGRDLRLEAVHADAFGQHLRVGVAGETVEVVVPLAGAFQASNALCAAGLAWACGADPRAALAALAALEPVPGRLERVGAFGSGTQVFVDYAHTPDALEAVLRALRPLAPRRLVVVFGCGGDRDAGKRPQMGAIAGRLADRVIVTDDNPRSEDPAEIRRQVLAGCPDATEIGDRRVAIFTAVRALGPGDIAVIAGKGHERGQIIGDRVLAFDDRAVAREALAGGGP